MEEELGPWERYRRKRDQLLVERGKQCAAELAALRAALGPPRDVWSIGHHLSTIFDRSLWNMPPFRRGMSGAWLRENVPGLSARTAQLYMLVARHFTKEDVAKWGHWVLASLMRHDKARFSAVRSGDPSERVVHVPTANGSWRATTLKAGVSGRELRRASRSPRAKK